MPQDYSPQICRSAAPHTGSYAAMRIAEIDGRFQGFCSRNTASANMTRVTSPGAVVGWLRQRDSSIRASFHCANEKCGRPSFPVIGQLFTGHQYRLASAATSPVERARFPRQQAIMMLGRAGKQAPASSYLVYECHHDDCRRFLRAAPGRRRRPRPGLPPLPIRRTANIGRAAWGALDEAIRADFACRAAHLPIICESRRILDAWPR